MNWHEVIDERSYEMDQAVADVLKRDPGKLDVVVAWIDRWLADPDFSTQSKEGLAEWLELIKSRGLAGVLEALRDRSEEGRRMRQNSPFAVIMPQAMEAGKDYTLTVKYAGNDALRDAGGGNFILVPRSEWGTSSSGRAAISVRHSWWR